MGVARVKSKSGVAVIALLSSVLLIPIAPVSADNKEIKVAAPEKKVKCKVTKALAQSPMRLPAPENLMKRAPKYLKLQTNCGNIIIETFAKAAPVTVTVMSLLARGGYFDRTLCHRLTTEGIFVLQCGDPTATGSGGPTFRYRDENLHWPRKIIILKAALLWPTLDQIPMALSSFWSIRTPHLA